MDRWELYVLRTVLAVGGSDSVINNVEGSVSLVQDTPLDDKSATAVEVRKSTVRVVKVVSMIYH